MLVRRARALRNLFGTTPAEAAYLLANRALGLRLASDRLPTSADAQFPGVQSRYEIWNGSSYVVTTFAGAVSFARASVAKVIGSDGALQDVASGDPRLQWVLVNGVRVSSGLLLEWAAPNGIRNNAGSGAVAGTPGTPPTNHAIPSPVAGLSIDQAGPIVDGAYRGFAVRVNGTATGTGNTTWFLEAVNVILAAASTDWCYSVWVKLLAGTAKTMQLRLAQNNAVNATLVTHQSRFFVPTGEWTRLWLPVTLSADAATAYVRPQIQNTGWAVSEVIDYTVGIALSRVEPGLIPTSSMHTSGADVTRQGDAATKTLGAEFNSAAQTALFRGRWAQTPRSTSDARLWQWDDGTENNRISARLSSGLIIAEAVVGGAVQATVTGPRVLPGFDHRVAIGFSTGVLRLVVDGVAYGDGAPASLPTGLTTRRIGCDSAGARQPGAAIQPYLAWPARSVLDASEFLVLLAASLLTTYTLTPVDAAIPSFGSMVPIGDSYIAGANATTDPNRFVNIALTRMVGGLASSSSLTPLNKGVSGCVLQNSNDATAAPRAFNVRDRFVTDTQGANERELLLIGAGFNDARYNAWPSDGLAGYTNDLREVIAGSLIGGYEPRRILLCSPWWISDTGLGVGGATFITTRAVVESFVAAAASVAAEYGVWYFDAYAYMRDHGGVSIIDTDNIHPPNAGHIILADGVMASRLANVMPPLGGVSASSAGAGALAMAWAASGKAVATYEVERAVEGTFAFGSRQSVASNLTAASWAGVAAGTYRVRARAQFSDGTTGPWAHAAAAQVVA